MIFLFLDLSAGQFLALIRYFASKKFSNGLGLILALSERLGWA